jgi:hypothetical protein
MALSEDGREIGPANATREQVADQGRGAWRIHFGNYLHFSASDNSDPSTNGRRYVSSVDLVAPARRPSRRTTLACRREWRRELFGNRITVF